jgi:hypothetical protein
MEDKYAILLVVSVPLLIALFILCSSKNPICIKLKMRNILLEVSSRKSKTEKKVDSQAAK